MWKKDVKRGTYSKGSGDKRMCVPRRGVRNGEKNKWDSRYQSNHKTNYVPSIIRTNSKKHDTERTCVSKHIYGAHIDDVRYVHVERLEGEGKSKKQPKKYTKIIILWFLHYNIYMTKRVLCTYTEKKKTATRGNECALRNDHHSKV